MRNWSFFFTAQNCCECSWKQLNLPFSPKWICVTNYKIYIGESKLAVFAYDKRNRKFEWTKQKFRALKLAVSLNEDIFWKLDPNIAHAYIHGSGKDLLYSLFVILKVALYYLRVFLDEWKVISRGVNCIGVNGTSAWYIYKGQIYVQLSLNREKPFGDESMKIECPVKVSKICVFKKVSNDSD